MAIVGGGADRFAVVGVATLSAARQPLQGRCQVGERRWRRGRTGWAVRRWLAGSRNPGDFAPGLAQLIHQPAVGGCREAMAPWAEVVTIGAERLEKVNRPEFLGGSAAWNHAALAA